MGPTIALELERLRDFVSALDKQIKECEEAITMNPHSVNPGGHVEACMEWANKCETKDNALKAIGRLALG